jgi:hypothetical protein
VADRARSSRAARISAFENLTGNVDQRARRAARRSGDGVMSLVTASSRLRVGREMKATLCAVQRGMTARSRGR